MTVGITRNKQVGRAAAWWLYEGATFTVYLMDSTGGGAIPDDYAPYEDWVSPTDFRVDSQLDLTLTGGSVDYGVLDSHVVHVPQLTITLSYLALGPLYNYTYTDLVITSTIANSSTLGNTDPTWAGTFTVATIHESSPITLNAAFDSKTYYLDITSTSALSEIEG